jgi:Protein of unknown function (DUF4242)
MDVHETLPDGATVQDVIGAHRADLQTQDQFGVKYLRYWVDEKDAKVFCLAEAPSADAAIAVHREAHGLLADRIYEVVEGTYPHPQRPPTNWLPPDLEDHPAAASTLKAASPVARCAAQIGVGRCAGEHRSCGGGAGGGLPRCLPREAGRLLATHSPSCLIVR